MCLEYLTRGSTWFIEQISKFLNNSEDTLILIIGQDIGISTRAFSIVISEIERIRATQSDVVVYSDNVFKFQNTNLTCLINYTSSEDDWILMNFFERLVIISDESEPPVHLTAYNYEFVYISSIYQVIDPVARVPGNIRHGPDFYHRLALNQYQWTLGGLYFNITNFRQILNVPDVKFVSYTTSAETDNLEALETIEDSFVVALKTKYFWILLAKHNFINIAYTVICTQTIEPVIRIIRFYERGERTLDVGEFLKQDQNILFLVKEEQSAPLLAWSLWKF